MCSFCAKKPENIRHLLWECEYTKKLLDDVKNWCSENNIHIDTDEKSFLFGSSSRKVCIPEQLIWLETKYYIYYCRCSKSCLNLTALKYRLKLLYSIIFKAAILEKTLEKFLERWEQFHDLFNEI